MNHPAHHPKPIIPPKRKRGGAQRETKDQKAFVDALNITGQFFVYRVKTMGTFDPVRRRFRKDATAKIGIPDICGFTKKTAVPIPLYIECKYRKGVGNVKKLLFSVKLSAEQKGFLLQAYRAGCRAGVAFTVEDAFAIAYADPVRHPRHPRTYAFLPEKELQEKAEEYLKRKKALAKINQDPLSHVLLTTRTEEWEEI